MKRHLHFWLTAAVLAVIDQFSKEAAFRAVAHGESYVAIHGALWVTPRYNPGAAFSFLGAAEHGNVLLTVISIVLVLALTILAYGHYRGGPTWAFGLIVGGAIGNIIDRILTGEGVRDFVDVHWWPVFNVADAAISAGVVVLIIWSLFYAKPHEPDPQAPARGRGSRG